MGQDDGIPNLAGQHRAYLERQLLAFRSGVRRRPETNFFARQASQDEFTASSVFEAALFARPSRTMPFDLDQCVQAAGAG
jgi:cytochrome c553